MKVDRLVSIIMILLEKERVGAQDLAEMFEVSPRTIYRDIDAINMAGIPVRSTSEVGGGFEIMQKYKIDKNVFPLLTFLMGLSNLSTMIRGDELEELKAHGGDPGAICVVTSDMSKSYLLQTLRITDIGFEDY